MIMKCFDFIAYVEYRNAHKASALSSDIIRTSLVGRSVYIYLHTLTMMRSN